MLTLGLAARMVVLSSRPLYTDDLWWHLSLGEAYLSQGPWLTADPVLHSAESPPDPASWLADATLFAIAQTFGLDALRVFHGVLVIGILALVWTSLRRASESRLVASAGTCAFVALAAYRLFQLRPELATISATLILYKILFEEDVPISGRRVALVAGLCLVWSNLHAGFLLGPVWIAIAALALLIGSFSGPEWLRSRDRNRGLRLAAAAILALLTTVANPSGSAAHLVSARAGHGTATLENIADEWAAFSPLRLPNMDLPPSPLAWGLTCLLLVAVPIAAFLILRRRHKQTTLRERGEPDVVLIALALASLVACLVAVRFLWLGVFPLLLLARMSRGMRMGMRAAPALATLVVLGLLVGFVRIGGGHRLARGIQLATFGDSYEVRKYYTHAVWFLRDTGVEGNLYNSYHMGGFLGFWLAPQLRVFVNGSLNVPEATLDTYRAIQRDAGSSSGTNLAALLERHDVDLFVGIGLPYALPPGRPWRYTAGLLERASDWTLVFRNLRSAVYLRDGEDNRVNLLRVKDYYACVGVPFDPVQGFDTERVMRDSPRWAEEHGLRIHGYEGLVDAAARAPARRRISALNLLAASHAAVGRYADAIRLDRRNLAHGVGSLATRRRLLWSLLRLDRVEEAQAIARDLAKRAAGSTLAESLVKSAERYASLEPGPQRDALVAMHPVFTRPEAAELARKQAAAEVRPIDFRRRASTACRGKGD